MIYDLLSAAHRYRALDARLRAGFDFLLSADLASMPLGRHELDGDRLLVSIQSESGRGESGARLEAHRAYADIQVAVSGEDHIGWSPLADCLAITEPYDANRDIIFFGDAPQFWLPLPPGRFAVFYPDDAHAPLAGVGPILKAVVKVAI